MSKAGRDDTTSFQMNPNPIASGNNKKLSKFVHVVTFPARILAKARDMYVSSLMSCASRVSQPHASCPRGCHDLPLPRSFSVGSSSSRFGGDDNDFRELMRVASVRTLLKDDRYLLSLREKMPEATTRGPKGMLPKSSSVIMGRIDEDKALDELGPDNYSGGVRDGDRVGSLNRGGPRFKSRSFAARNRSSVF